MDPEELAGLVVVSAKETLELFQKGEGAISGRMIYPDNRMEEKEFSISDFLVNEQETLMTKYGDILESVLKKNF